jgi:hypothetical protein
LPRLAAVAAALRDRIAVMRAWIPFLAVALFVGMACDSPHCPNSSHGACEPIVRGPIDPAGQVHRFVIDSVHLATDATDSYTLGFNLDGDPHCGRNNAIGEVLQTLFYWLDTDGNTILAELIADGRILHLLELQATSLDDADGASLRVYVGIDTDGDPTDNFSGTETFGIDATVATEAMAGAVRAGTLDAAVGVVPLQIALPGVDEPFVLSLGTAIAELAVDPDGQRAYGRIGGSLTTQQVHDELLPIVWMALAQIVEADCPGGTCAPGSRGEAIIYLEDCSEGSATCDGYLALDEFRDNPLVQSLISPDVDLFDEQGRYNPRCDKIKDALSVAVSFTAVPAEF